MQTISQRRLQFYLLKAFTLSVLTVHSPGLLYTWYRDAWDKTIPLHYGFLKCESCRRGFIQREDSSLWREGQRWFQSVVYCTLHFKHSQTLLTCPIDWVVILLLNSYWSHTHTAHSGCSQFTQPDLGWPGKSHSNKCISAFPWSRSRENWIKCKVGRKNCKNVTDGGPEFGSLAALVHGR